MDRRIAPPREYEEFLDRLTDEGLFETKQKAIMYAAALGQYLKKRTPVERRGVAIRYDIFANVLDDSYINAAAVADAKDLKLLAQDRLEERVTIFEEYVHTGLAEMQRRLSQPGSQLDALLKMAYDARHGAESDVVGIDPDVLRDLAL
jgi:dnd system-associated protein 4